MINHFMIKAQRCNPSKSAVRECLDKLRPADIIAGPHVVERQDGFFAYYASHNSHSTISIIRGEAVLTTVSSDEINENEIISLFATLTQKPLEDLRAMHLSSEQAIECQEPRCTRPATKDHNGLKVCADHYEQWVEREEADERAREQR